tara:strand:- start:160 stop:774 length:615 start_codon:yes stop_codon:yes gene_type:complete
MLYYSIRKNENPYIQSSKSSQTQKDQSMTTENTQTPEISTDAIFACYDMVRGVLLSKCKNPSLAHDHAMNGILKAIENMDKYNGKSKVSTWVCTVAYRLWLDSIRSHSNSKTTYTGDAVFLENVGGSYVIEEFDNGLDNSVITEALAKLSDNHKQVLTLHYIEGLKYREIAERINKPIGTVMSRINQAKAKLKGNNALVAMMKQ